MALYTPFMQQAGANIGNALANRGQNRMAGDAYMGKPGAMEKLMQFNPQMGMQIQQQQQADEQKKVQQAAKKQTDMRKLYADNKELFDGALENAAKFETYEEAYSYLDQEKESFRNIVGDAVDSFEFTPEMFSNIKQVYGDEGAEYSMGSGPMAGYVFNKSTGELSIDPKIKEAMKADAATKASKKGMLTSKDVSGINDKVTSLVKAPQEILSAAKDLKELRKNSSPASQLAGVIKFMKALDPTSVVKETEQGQVYSASGAASQLAGKLNKLMGDGELSPEGFDDIVNTAAILADSSISATEESLSGYLGVIEDKISKKDYDNLLKRLPSKIGSVESKPNIEDLVNKYAD